MLSAENMTLIRADKTICEALSFQIKPGEVWGVLGNNGSGKSTLLEALAGLFPLKAGSIAISARSLATYPRIQVAKQIGLLLQTIEVHFGHTVFEYCLISRYPHLSTHRDSLKEDQEMVIAALTAMDLFEYQHRLVTQLSGGEKKRLALAALLVQTPQYYLLDEPTNHLDLYYQMHVMRYFTALAKNENKALVMVLHDINLAQQFCDQLILLYENGRALTGVACDLLTTTSLSELYGHPIKCLAANEERFWYAECNPRAT